MFDEGIMFFGRTSGEGCEPVRIVAGAVVYGPLTHAFGYVISYCARNRLLVFDSIDKGRIGFGRKILEHCTTVENQFAIILVGAFGGSGYRHCLAVKRLFDHFES